MKQDPFSTDDGRSKCNVRLSNEAYRRVQLYSIHWKTTQSALVDSLILKYLPPVQITFASPPKIPASSQEEPDTPPDPSCSSQETKHCPQCSETKPIDQFYRNRPHSDGSPSLFRLCKPCTCARTRARRKKTGDQFTFYACDIPDDCEDTIFDGEYPISKDPDGN